MTRSHSPMHEVTITKLRVDNPCRPGSVGYARWAWLKDDTTYTITKRPSLSCDCDACRMAVDLMWWSDRHYLSINTLETKG
jgi:hypothetical protein